MITDAAITFLLNLLTPLVDGLDALGIRPPWPDWFSGTGPGTISGAFSWVAGGFAPFASWVNLPLLVSVAGFLLSFRVAMFAWSLALRVAHFARGSAG
jgi:hypothetical protein